MSWRARIITLLPSMFPGPLATSLAGRALQDGLWALDIFDLRDFGIGKHKIVDSPPAGGGAGMVLRADVAGAALDKTCQGHENLPCFALSPRGKPLTQDKIRELATGAGVILLCARFEGMDERVLSARPIEEISIGDYILSGGEPAALVLLDAVVRLLPGVMGKAESAIEESFENGLLEYPHYTKPTIWEGQEIPAILSSGNHQKIAAWRRTQAENITRTRRPDLWQNVKNKGKI
ncbi:MAG: tRNA (guanosine(37)-N1)-methyltransferase TrmD [Alphaproteobacteria bacterium]|nr:tRNA (guanosine(37)-N1)-methyltransferase TrmD [Alphaproteobacteria bacterium]